MNVPGLGRVSVPLAGSALLLMGLGLFALWAYDQDGHAYSRRQLIFAGVAATVMAAAMLPHYRLTRHAAWPAYAAGIAALVALLLFGRYTRGSRGWFSLGPVSVQPVELVKIACVMALARWLSLARDLDTWRGLAGPALLAGAPAALVLVQPDLGNALLFLPVLLAMLYVAGARTKHLAIVVALLLVAAPVAYRFGLKEYQRNRLTSFLWPDRVPPELSYQQTQSVKAVASGGIAGEMGGGGQGSYYVPDRHTDFIFSIVAEELGFVGTSFALLLFAVFFAQSGRIAAQTREPYGRLLTVGLLGFLALQVFINVGMAIGVAPITGLTLPFMSYGGSSLVSSCLAVGLILNVGARWVPTWARRDLDTAHVAIREFVPHEKLGALK